MRIGVVAACVLVFAAGIGGAACGKRGAPIAPNVRIPAAIDTMAASRLGSDVYITLTVPATNIDESIPIDIQRIDVYGYTGRATPTAARFAGLGAVVASIPVVAPRRIGEGAESPPPAPDPSAGALPGTSVTIVDTLTADEFVQGQVYTDPRRPEPIAVPAAGAQTPPILRRFYLAIPFSLRGRPGPPGTLVDLVLTALPDPPSNVRAGYDTSAISLTWEPSGGLLGFLLDRALPLELAPFVASTQGPVVAGAQPAADAGIPPGPTTYNVYKELAPDPFELPPAGSVPAWTATSPLRINTTTLAATSTTDQPVPGRQHCYSVRAQRGTIVSEPSPRTCIVPIDIFPPAVPTGLAAVPSEGGISLIWEPNGELDLGGYLVLRREAGDATLRQLTPTPVADARYRDTDVQPGTRYMYSVVAVDAQVPLPNVSAESERVEESAR
ncbi:MAG: hypothetical protein ACRD3C_06335 [Vicinamibacterales bacterium]